MELKMKLTINWLKTWLFFQVYTDVWSSKNKRRGLVTKSKKHEPFHSKTFISIFCLNETQTLNEHQLDLFIKIKHWNETVAVKSFVNESINNFLNYKNNIIAENETRLLRNNANVSGSESKYLNETGIPTWMAMLVGLVYNWDLRSHDLRFIPKNKY